MKTIVFLLIILLGIINNIKAQNLVGSTISYGGSITFSTNFGGSTLGEYNISSSSVLNLKFYHGFQLILGDIINNYPSCLNVTTNIPNGTGSLRYAISCANSGDVITFDNTIGGDYIYLDLPAININKNLTFLNNNNQFLKNIDIMNNEVLLNISESILFDGLGLEGTSENALKINLITSGSLELINTQATTFSINN